MSSGSGSSTTSWPPARASATASATPLGEAGAVGPTSYAGRGGTGAASASSGPWSGLALVPATSSSDGSWTELEEQSGAYVSSNDGRPGNGLPSGSHAGRRRCSLGRLYCSRRRFGSGGQAHCELLQFQRRLLRRHSQEVRSRLSPDRHAGALLSPIPALRPLARRRKDVSSLPGPTPRSNVRLVGPLVWQLPSGRSGRLPSDLVQPLWSTKSRPRLPHSVEPVPGQNG